MNGNQRLAKIRCLSGAKGFEKNWIPTVPGRGWFTLFRLYAPTEAYFDKSWPLPPIVKVK